MFNIARISSESGFEMYHRLAPESAFNDFTNLCHHASCINVESICSGVPHNIFADLALGKDAC